jgi:hypothetical protein
MLSFVQDAIDKYFDKFEVRLVHGARSGATTLPPTHGRRFRHPQLYCFKNTFHLPDNVPVPGDPVRLSADVERLLSLTPV